MSMLLTLLRKSAGILLLLELVILLGLVGVTQVAQHLGFPAYVIRGSSMAPAIPLGALVIDQPVDAAEIAPGDVVSVRGLNAVIYTHRVVSVTTSSSELAFETRGDSNATADPVPVPATAIVGRVLFAVPIAGYLVALLGIPAGLFSLLSIVGSTLLLHWLLDDPDEIRAGRPGSMGIGGPITTPAAD